MLVEAITWAMLSFVVPRIAAFTQHQQRQPVTLAQRTIPHLSLPPRLATSRSTLSVIMGSPTTDLDLLVLVSFLAVFSAIRDYRRRGGLPYPPGPRPLPLIGNILISRRIHSSLKETWYELLLSTITPTEGTTGDIVSLAKSSLYLIPSRQHIS